MSGQIFRTLSGALAVAVVATACGAAITATPSVTLGPTPAPTVAPTRVPSTPTVAPRSPTPAPTLPPLRSGNSAAGTYRTEQVQPEMHVTLPDGWTLYFNDAGGAYMSTGGGELLLARPQQVIVPDTNDHEPAPEDLMDWFVDHPSLNVTEPTPIEISGHDAAYVEIDTTHRVDVFYDPLGNFHVGPGKGVRFYVIPWEGADILVALMKDEFGEFDEALEAGVPVVESLEIVPE